jgi:hypothetical protein
MGKTLKIIVDKINSLFTPPKEPVEPREERLAPPLTYYTMDVAATDNYDDNHFYNDLDSMEKPYEIPKDYEEV